MRHAPTDPCRRLLTTGQAARLLSVTPDTVLKWIRAGKLPAVRTAGGHHRIAAADVERLLAPERPGRTEVYCWEFFLSGGELSPRCRLCPVYRFRAARCYEVRRAGLAMPGAFDGCPPSCESCGYFRIVSQAPRRLLVATPDPVLRGHLERLAGRHFEVRSAGTLYEMAALVLEFRPSVVLVDADGFPRAVWQPLLRDLAGDRRLGPPRVALLASKARPPGNANVEILSRRPTLRRLLQWAGCLPESPRRAFPEVPAQAHAARGFHIRKGQTE